MALREIDRAFETPAARRELKRLMALGCKYNLLRGNRQPNIAALGPSVSPTGKLAHEHGWEVPLRCPRCGVEAEPACDGWAPNHAIHFGKTPTVFVNVSCAACSADLRDAAGNKLVELFGDVATNSTNRWLIAVFAIYFLLMLPLLLWAAMRFPAARGLEAMIAVGHVLLIHPIIRRFNNRVAALRQSCACGKPQYKFLGMLGRSSCYRCSTCGQLLRVRD